MPLKRTFFGRTYNRGVKALEKIVQEVGNPADVTLNLILENPYTSKLFERFVRQEHSHENLLFYREIEAIESLEEHQMMHPVVLMGIVGTFVSQNARQEVNIEGALRNKIEKNVTEIESIVFDDRPGNDKNDVGDECNSDSVVDDLLYELTQLLVEAGHIIYNLMKTDTLPRFMALHSPTSSSISAFSTTLDYHSASSARVQ